MVAERLAEVTWQGTLKAGTALVAAISSGAFR
jgi:hypothetical protein